MSTEIKTIKGSCHNRYRSSAGVIHGKAGISLTRFFNGKDRGANIQLTISQDGGYGTSYIHLNKGQCQLLAKALLECFNYDKYPSE